MDVDFDNGFNSGWMLGLNLYEPPVYSFNREIQRAKGKGMVDVKDGVIQKLPDYVGSTANLAPGVPATLPESKREGYCSDGKCKSCNKKEGFANWDTNNWILFLLMIVIVISMYNTIVLWKLKYRVKMMQFGAGTGVNRSPPPLPPINQ